MMQCRRYIERLLGVLEQQPAIAEIPQAPAVPEQKLEQEATKHIVVEGVDGETAIPEQAPKLGGKKSVAEATASIIEALGTKRLLEGGGKGKAKGKAKAKSSPPLPVAPKAKAGPKAKSSPPGKAKVKAKGGSAEPKIEISHERSRSQFLCRTGLPDHPSKVFSYDSEANQKKASKLAKAWCRDLFKSLRLPCPEKFLS